VDLVHDGGSHCGGFANLKPGAEYDALYTSAQCRADADWLVGMNGSRAFTLRYDSLLSIGRVQTPTLSLLVQREKEIRAFVPEDYYEVIANFGGYKGTYIDGKKQTKIDSKEKAEAIVAAVKGQIGKIISVETQRKKTPPPLLYDLTTLQREANARFGFTAQATLDIVQALYERHKMLTYPRTDSRYLSDDMKPKMEKLLNSLPAPYAEVVPKGEDRVNPGKRVFDDSKLTDHHAIVPTGKFGAALNPNEQKIFDMVVRQVMAAFSKDFVYDATQVITEVQGNRFLSKGRQVVETGWQKVNPPMKSKKETEEEQTLPGLTEGMEVKAKDAKVQSKKTTPPSPYNENTLLGAMENAGRFVQDEELRRQLKERGLGTPATRAAIIERLITVGYVERQKKSLIPTDKGIKLIEVVPIQMSSPETTGRWEKGLNDIALGKMDPEKFMASIRRYCAFLCQYAVTAPAQSFPKREYTPKKTMKKTPAKKAGNAKQAGTP